MTFWLHFLFRRDQKDYYFDLKNLENVEQILKKQRPNKIQILWIVKNHEHRNIATLSCHKKGERLNNSRSKADGGY